MTWLAAAFPTSAEVHVVPVADVVERTVEDCVCGPDIEPVFRDDGSNGWLSTQHSLDRREASE